MRQEWEAVKESRSFSEFYFFAIALILAFGTLQTAGTVFQTDKPVVSVVSCSMYPKYHVGDVLVVQGAEFSELEKGEVIVYSTPEMEIPVVHRVVEKHRDYLETRGDNNPSQLPFEDQVEPGQVYGTSVFRIPRVGVLKLVAMDLTGVGSSNVEGRPNRPVRVDNRYLCELRVPMEAREY